MGDATEKAPKRVDTETQSIPQIKIMSPPTPRAKVRRESWNTGFPEPLDGDRNTTLPHPDADTSANAAISDEDLESGHAQKRRRHSFLKKHRRTVSHGYISPQTEAIHSLLSLSLDLSRSNSKSHSPTPSKDEADSVRWAPRDDDTPPTSPEQDQSPRKGLLGKWRRSLNR